MLTALRLLGEFKPLISEADGLVRRNGLLHNKDVRKIKAFS